MRLLLDPERGTSYRANTRHPTGEHHELLFYTPRTSRFFGCVRKHTLCPGPIDRKIILRNDGIEAQFSRRGNALHGAGIVNHATGYDWLEHGTPAGVFLLQGETQITGFDDNTKLKFQNSRRSANKQGGQDHVLTWSRADGLAVDWTARSFAKTSTVEFQANLRNSGSKAIPQLKEFGPLALRLRGGDDKLIVHWVRRDAYKKHEILLKDSFSVSGGSWNAPAVAEERRREPEDGER